MSVRSRPTFQLQAGQPPAETPGSDLTSMDPEPDPNGTLRTDLRRLADQQRGLIERPFWEVKTEVEVAGVLCLTQSGISRRKRRILEQLRRWIDSSEQEKSNSRKD